MILYVSIRNMCVHKNILCIYIYVYIRMYDIYIYTYICIILHISYVDSNDVATMPV